MAIIRYQAPELTPWTPFERLTTLRDEMNRLFESTLAPFGATRDVGLFGGWTPPLDLYEDKENVFVKIELPGMKREEIDISLHEGMLTIAGERKTEKETKEGETYRSERSYGRFHRTVTLPAEVKGDQVKANYKDGILTVQLPKAEEAKPKQIEVKVD
jgi:HSP20 family protein